MLASIRENQHQVERSRTTENTDHLLLVAWAWTWTWAWACACGADLESAGLTDGVPKDMDMVDGNYPLLIRSGKRVGL